MIKAIFCQTKTLDTKSKYHHTQVIADSTIICIAAQPRIDCNATLSKRISLIYIPIDWETTKLLLEDVPSPK